MRSLRVPLPILALILAPLVLAAEARAQGTMRDYARAEHFLGDNAQDLVVDDAVDPHWIAGEDRFWFRDRTPSGYEFMVVDAATGMRSPLFDHARLAAALSTAADTAYAPLKLPFRDLKLVRDGRAVRFAVGKGRNWTCDLTAYSCVGPDTIPIDPPDAVPSPDGKWIAFTRHDNLWIRNAASGEEVQLTKDAEPDWGYAKPTGCCAQVTSVRLKRVQRPVLVWSPDSKKIATYKMDERHVRQMHLLETKNPAPVLYTYRYALPGDSVVPMYDTYVFDVGTRTGVKVDLPPQPAVNTTCCWLTAGPVLKDTRWGSGSDQVYFTYGSRGFHSLALIEADTKTGRARTILTEKSPTFVETNLASGGIPNWRLIHDNHDAVWFSERDGWAHLYLVDAATGRVKNRITPGAWTVGDVLRIDELAGWIYFTGRGREAGRNPYFRHLYRARLDGTGLTLLTPENGDHDVSFSPSGKYFVDSYSRPDATPVTVVRRADGTLVHEIQHADASRLFAVGWHYPTPFTVKARDGLTDLYGLLYTPSNLDSTKRYPIIDNIYPGPQIGSVGRWNFSAGRSAQALAELGFVVIQLDAMGTPFRSKAFHDTFYRNMGDNGIPDQVTAIKQLAARYPFIDLNRVGIYGHSGGGFASTDAMLRYPDFFKVAVSSSGNHDNRSYDYTWGEKYQGLLTHNPDGTDSFDPQSNWRLAKNLKGKLLLMYGTLDDNVPPNNTLEVVNALIAANKDFDMLVLPNRNHGLGEPYVTRRTWDYFVRNLLGVEPPPQYPLKVPGASTPAVQ